MDNKNYKVVIFSTPQHTEETIDKLAALFKISTDKAAQILQRDEFTVRKQVDKNTAEKFHKAISSLGVNCRVDELQPEEPTLPAIEEDIQVPRNEQVASNEPPPGQDRLIHHKQRNLSLQSQGIAADINPDYYCPDCGAIRSSADEVCKQCGFDPANVRQQARSSSMVKLAIAVSVVVVVAIVLVLVATPFYQLYVKRSQLQDDLLLAFDARNQVTEFIERTNFWPNQNIDAGLPKQISNRSVESVIVGENAVITVTLRAEALDGEAQTLVLTPNAMKGRIVWNCQGGTLSEEYRPAICLGHANN